MMKLLLFFTMIFSIAGAGFSSAIATQESKSSAKKILKEMTLTYSQVEYMKADYVKKQTSDLLGEVTKTKGELEFSKGRMRVEETSSKKRNIFIKNKEKFWHLRENYEVLVGEVGKHSPTVFELIFSDPSVWDKYPAKVEKVRGSDHTISVETSGALKNFKNLILMINTKKRRLEELSFVDDIGNKTEMKFKNTYFYRSAKEKRFTYSPKKSEKVIQM